jgi:hypothetical protein
MLVMIGRRCGGHQDRSIAAGDEAERRRRAREIEIGTRLSEVNSAHLLVPSTLPSTVTTY